MPANTNQLDPRRARPGTIRTESNSGSEAPPEAEVRMGLITTCAAIHVHSICPTINEGANSHKETRARRDFDVIGKKMTYFIFASTVFIPILKIVGSLTVLFIDIEMDHLCHLADCNTLVYTSDDAIYFLVCLVFLIASVYHLYLGLQIFTRFPDTRCLLVIDNITIKMITGPMKVFATVTAFEMFVVVLAALYSQSQARIIFPSFFILAVEVGAFTSVFCYPTKPPSTYSVVSNGDSVTESSNESETVVENPVFHGSVIEGVMVADVATSSV